MEDAAPTQPLATQPLTTQPLGATPVAATTPGSRPDAGAGVPERIGRYRVLRELGRGATSRVFLAEDEFHGRPVAIKAIRADAAPDTDLRRRYERVFMNEAALAGKLQHPHIVGIYDAVSTDDAQYLVMEYVPGRTLEHWASPESLLPVETVVEIVFKACVALDYAHRHGVIHCDIKPANLLLASGSDVKVSDFGAAFYASAEHTYLTGVGSPAYMSPEQVHEKQLNHQTDIFSLGIVFHQLLTGRLPFQASNRGSLLYQIANLEPLPVSQIRPELPAALDPILAKMLAKSREERYSDWLKIAGDIAEVFRHLTVPQQSVSDTEKFSALRALPLFVDFRDVELWELTRLSSWARHKAGSVIVAEGSTGGNFHVLTTGDARVTREGNVLELLRAGQVFGDILYFEDQAVVRTTAITAETPCTVMSVQSAAARQASDALQMLLSRAFIRVLVHRIEHRDRRLVAQAQAHGLGQTVLRR
ncbi:MAG: protein kinase [Burkholderiales bacterium]|jgi:serine/threonine protein kinase|nr:protein kinase [Burkholderiales bacterium]